MTNKSKIFKNCGGPLNKDNDWRHIFNKLLTQNSVKATEKRFFLNSWTHNDKDNRGEDKSKRRIIWKDGKIPESVTNSEDLIKPDHRPAAGYAKEQQNLVADSLKGLNWVANPSTRSELWMCICICE